MSGVTGGQIWTGTASNNRFGPTGTIAGFANTGTTAIPGVQVDGLDGADTITGLGVADSLSGGAGNDSLLGDAGADTLIGGLGTVDRLLGGADNDLLVETGEAAGDSARTIDGGGGTDILRVDGIARFLTTTITGIEQLDLQLAAQVTLTRAQFDAIGTFSFASNLGGAAAAVVVTTGGVFDFRAKTILATSADPAAIGFTGGALADTVFGTGGSDVIAAGAGINDVAGGTGNDTLSGGGTLRGNDGNDLVSDGAGGTGNDRLEGNVGNDTVSSLRGADTLTGGPGDDLLRVTGTDLVGRNLDGGDGNDQLVGGRGNDTLTGGNGDDTFEASAAGGDAGNISGGGGTDVLIAHGDVSRLSISGMEILRVVDSGVVTGGHALFSAFNTFELVADGPAQFRINQAGTYDLVTGRNFNEGTDFTIDARTVGGSLLDTDEGRQFLRSGTGADTLRAGLGADTLDSGAGSDLLDGGEGNDSLRAGDGDNTADGGAGADTIMGGAGVDELSGGDDADRISGLGGDDFLKGDAANDSVYGGLGNDNIEGGEGSDRLFGDGGADTLDGGFGADQLTGGAGADGFLLDRSGSGVDRFLDFNPAEDLILLSQASYIGLTPGPLPGPLLEFSATGDASGTGGPSFVYDGATGRLYFDFDGDGAIPGQLLAILTGAPTLTAADFLIF
jgi:Ca2+-binding RTX toxin-like protein